MKKVTVYRSDDGHLNENIERIAAHNLHYRLPKYPADVNSKVLGYSECLEVVTRRALIEQVFAEMDAASGSEPRT